MNGRNTDGTFTVGNAGRPKGARNKATQAVLALLEGEAEALSRKAVEMALAGDSVALRLCLDRLAPPRKDAPVQFQLPRMITASDAAQAAGAVLEAVSEGDLHRQRARWLWRWWTATGGRSRLPSWRPGWQCWRLSGCDRRWGSRVSYPILKSKNIRRRCSQMRDRPKMAMPHHKQPQSPLALLNQYTPNAHQF